MFLLTQLQCQQNFDFEPVSHKTFELDRSRNVIQNNQI